MTGNKRKRRFVRRIPKYKYERHLIKGLEQRIATHAPDPGTDPATAAPPSNPSAYVGARLFSQLPISKPTLDGLNAASYTEMTDIQRSALPHGLAGRDILGAAKTGSGKTLAFLITMLEKLYRLQWTKADGLGGLIISPVRELALQIFEELKKVGKHHDFSAGLLIGGKDVDVERSRVGLMNILVTTPGRLLHHLDASAHLDVSHLRILVLDEADRLLDMGFSKMINGIIEHLPKERQSLLFSATQTKSVDDLVRLSLKEPEFLSVHADALTATPVKLKEFYVISALEEKMTVLWSFIKTHPGLKMIVFVSTCTQVRFLYEALKALLSTAHVCCLHGRIKQNKRTDTFFQFCQSKAAVLLATDVAARGLDFPEVDWVVQLDCADTVSEYIHRVGRTARYTAEGRALLVLLPQEAHFLPKLQQRQIPIKEMKLKTSSLTCPTVALQSLLTKIPKLKDCAQKALVMYLKSYLLNSNNEVDGLKIEAFAAALGLMTLPPSKALKKIIRRIQSPDTPTIKKRKIKSVKTDNSEANPDDDDFFIPTEASSIPEQRPLADDVTGDQSLLLKQLTETWIRASDGDGEEGHAGVFDVALDRFASLKQSLQERRSDDRAFVKSRKKDAAQKSKEQTNNGCIRTPIVQLVPIPEASDDSELIEIESDSAAMSDDMCDDATGDQRTHTVSPQRIRKQNTFNA